MMQQSNFCFGLTGAQIQQMQGGKLRGSEMFYGHQISAEERAEYKAKELESREQYMEKVKEEAQCHPLLIKLHEARIPDSQILQAAKELNEENDDSLILDLIRIHGIKIS